MGGGDTAQSTKVLFHLVFVEIKQEAEFYVRVNSARDWVGSRRACEPSEFKRSLVFGVRGDHENKSPSASHRNFQKSGRTLEFHRAWNEEFKAILSRPCRPRRPQLAFGLPIKQRHLRKEKTERWKRKKNKSKKRVGRRVRKTNESLKDDQGESSTSSLESRLRT